MFLNPWKRIKELETELKFKNEQFRRVTDELHSIGVVLKVIEDLTDEESSCDG